MNIDLILLPVLVPIIFAVIGLILYRLPKIQGWLALAGMGISMTASLALFSQVVTTGSPVVLQLGGWQAPFGISLVLDMLSGFFVVMAQIVLFIGVIHALGSKEKCVQFPTFFPMFMLLGTGLTGCFMTGDIFNLFVFLEVLALSSVVLCAISDDRYGPEAAYKYFFMSQLAAFFMLLSVGALYVSIGTLNMAHIAQLIPNLEGSHMMGLSVPLLMATFMIKGATFPFHFWQPDCYNSAPTPAAAMFSSVVGKLGIYGFIRMIFLLFPTYADQMQMLLIVLGIIGIAFGGISAIGTHNAKRMLAFSTMAQMGFILVGIGWGTPLSLAAALIFAFNHSLIKSAMLMLAGFLTSRTQDFTASLKHLTGAGNGQWLAGVLFFIGALALAGIPPTNGFISKMLVFDAGIKAENFYGLALIGVSAIFTLVYTTRAFMKIFWEKAPETMETPEGDTVAVSFGAGDNLLAPALLMILVVGVGIFAAPLVDVAMKTAAWILDPNLYITAVLGGN